MCCAGLTDVRTIEGNSMPAGPGNGQEFDLVLLDLMLPRAWSDWECCRHLRRLILHPF